MPYDLNNNRIEFPVLRHLVDRSVFTLCDRSTRCYCFGTKPVAVARLGLVSWLNSYQYYNIKPRRDFSCRNVEKHHVFDFETIRNEVIEAVGFSTCGFPPANLTTQSLCRITSATLDPCKHWYLLLKEVCDVPLRKYFICDVFKIFPDEIQSVATRELQPANSSFGVVGLARIPDLVHVVFTFCLIAGLSSS